MILGNDISTFQGEIDWDLYTQNTNFVLIKATEGVGFIDARFYVYLNEARNRALSCGFYHFAHPELGNTPQAEAAYFLATIGDLRVGEILALDYEVEYRGDVVGWCKAFLDEIQNKTGIKPFIYLNQALCQQYDWTPVITADYALWVAAYTGDPSKNDFNGGKWQVAAMQQWTDAQTVPGINDAVDGDVFFGDITALKAYGFHQPTLSPAPTPPVIPTPPSAPTDPCAEEKQRIEALITLNTAYVKKIENLIKVNTEYSQQIVVQQQNILELQRQLTVPQKVAIDYIQEWLRNLLKGGK